MKPETGLPQIVDAPRSTILLCEEQDMGRRLFQQKGDLYKSGGWWRLRWRQDTDKVNPKTGKPLRGWSPPVIVGPAPGNAQLKPLTRREAMREAWERFLSRLDQNIYTPKSVSTVAQFVEKKFLPDHVALQRKNTRIHYGHLLKNHVLPALGDRRLRDVKRDDVQRLVASVITSGLSVQTAKHIRKTISAVFRLAEDLEWSTGNPARRIRFPEHVTGYRAVPTWPQVQQIAALLVEPYRSMVIVLAQTGMRVGELCGLLWKWVNLSDADLIVEGERVPAYSILVRENFTAGESQPSPKNKKIRQVPMTAEVWVQLMNRWELASAEGIASLSSSRGANGGVPVGENPARQYHNQLVFPNRKGKPRDAHNIENRHYKPAAVKIGLPSSTIHCLRHTLATMADAARLTMGQRMELLGHSHAKTTMGYTHADMQDVREKLEQALDMTRKEIIN